MRLWLCHASSANTERIFSGLGRIMTPLRNRLSLKTITELMSIKVAKMSSNSLCSFQRRASSASLGSQDSSISEITRERRDSVIESTEVEDKLDELTLGEPLSSYPMLEASFLELADEASGSYVSLPGYSLFNRFISFNCSVLDSIRINTDQGPSTGRTSAQRADSILEEVDYDSDGL